MPTPISPQATASIYASDILSNFDIHKPENLNKLFRAKGSQGYEYFMVLKSLGFEMPVAQDEYSHYEERFIHDTFTVDSHAAGAAGATVTLNVQPSSVQLYNGSIYNIYPRLWDVIMFPDGTTASVTNVGTITAGGANIDVTPNVLTANIPAVSSGDEIVIISDAFAEGSTQPAGRLSGTDKYTNFVQIIKESLNATGTEMTNQDWFDTLVDDNGSTKSIIGYVMKGQIDLDYRIALLSSNALLFSQPTTNTNSNLNDSTTPTNAKIKTTEGLIPATRRAGQVLPYPTGLFSISKFNEIDDRLDREFCGQDVLGLVGIDLSHQIEDTMVNYFKNTDISYVSQNYFKGSEGLAMSVGFKSFNKSGRTYNFQKMGIFSHPKVGGATGYPYPSMGLFLPMNKQKDKKTGEAIPSFGCRYKSLGAYSRKMEVWNVSGAGSGVKVIPEDLANFYMRTHVGAQHIGANRFVLLDPQ